MGNALETDQPLFKNLENSGHSLGLCPLEISNLQHRGEVTTPTLRIITFGIESKYKKSINRAKHHFIVQYVCGGR